MKSFFVFLVSILMISMNFAIAAGGLLVKHFGDIEEYRIFLVKNSKIKIISTAAYAWTSTEEFKQSSNGTHYDRTINHVGVVVTYEKAGM